MAARWKRDYKEVRMGAGTPLRATGRVQVRSNDSSNEDPAQPKNKLIKYIIFKNSSDSQRDRQK